MKENKMLNADKKNDKKIQKSRVFTGEWSEESHVSGDILKFVTICLSLLIYSMRINSHNLTAYSTTQHCKNFSCARVARNLCESGNFY